MSAWRAVDVRVKQSLLTGRGSSCQDMYFMLFYFIKSVQSCHMLRCFPVFSPPLMCFICTPVNTLMYFTCSPVYLDPAPPLCLVILTWKLSLVPCLITSCARPVFVNQWLVLTCNNFGIQTIPRTSHRLIQHLRWSSLHTSTFFFSFLASTQAVIIVLHVTLHHAVSHHIKSHRLPTGTQLLQWLWLVQIQISQVGSVQNNWMHPWQHLLRESSPACYPWKPWS